MDYFIQPHHTFALHGTLAVGDVLFIQASYQFNGGVGTISRHATNDGTIVINGEPGYGGYHLSAAATLENSGVLTNNGVINVESGSSYGSSSGSGGLLLNDGTLVNAGSIMVGGPFGSSNAYPDPRPARLQDNGVLHNAGRIEIAAFYDSYYNGHYGVSAGRLSVAGVMTNGGTIVMEGNVYGGSTLDVTGELENFVSGAITGAGSGGIGGFTLKIESGGTLDNDGLLLLTGDVTSGYQSSTVAGVIYNSGIVDLQNGYGLAGAVLHLTGRLNNDGAINIATQSSAPTEVAPLGATLTVGGALVNIGAITVMTNTAGSAGGGGVLAISGQLNNQNGSKVSLQGGVSTTAQATPGATLALSGSLSNIGEISVGGGSGAGQGARLLDTGRLLTAGTIDIAAGRFGAASGLLLDSGLLKNDGLITVGAPTAGGGLQGLVITASGTLTGDGTINDTGVLTNSGLIEVAASGHLTITGAIGGVGGQFYLGRDSTLTLAGPVDVTQHVTIGADATLALADPKGFAASLTLSSDRSTIDLLHSEVLAATDNGATLALMLTNGQLVDFSLADTPASSIAVSLQSDQHGGTNVIVSGAQAASPDHKVPDMGWHPILVPHLA
jgi:filamentous hemagglutinin